MAHWVRHRACAQPVSVPSERLPIRPSIEAVMLRVQASHEGSSPEFLRIPPVRTFRRAPAYQGFRPSSRHPRGASTYREGSQAFTTFRPQAFSASRRFAPRSVFAGLFHPAATSRVHRLSRGFSPRVAPPSLRRASAPLSFGVRALASRSWLPSPIRLDSEASFHARARCPCRRV